MLWILRDPIWQFIQTIIAVGGIIITLVLWLTDRRRKALAYEAVFAPLPFAKRSTSSESPILFRGNPVHDMSRVKVRIINSGNAEIRSSDYEIPISFSFGEKAKVLTATVIDASPSSLRELAKIDKEGAKAILEPILLNSRESLTLSMLISQFDGHVTPHGRVVGVREIKESSEDRAARLPIVLVGFSTSVLIVVVVVTLLFPAVVYNSSYRSGFFAACVTSWIIGYASMALQYWWDRILYYQRPREGTAHPNHPDSADS